jgi:hypothetical protein
MLGLALVGAVACDHRPVASLDALERAPADLGAADGGVSDGGVDD